MHQKTDFQSMVPALSFEDLNVGETWISPGRTVTDADIVNFACQTGDFNSLHVDAEFAAGTVYRKPIAHGLMGMSWAAGLGSNFPRVSTLSFAAIRDWEFLRPVYAGDTLHAATQVLDKRPTGRRSGKVAWLIKVVNQKSEVVQQGVFETLVATRLREGKAVTKSLTERPVEAAVGDDNTNKESSSPPS
jgi:acyl dehydratase